MGAQAGSSFSRVAGDLAADFDSDQPAAAHQLMTRRGASSGSRSGPQVRQVRGGTQGGVDATGRSRSLGGHQGVRAMRHARVVEQLDTFQSVNTAAMEDVQFLKEEPQS